MLSHMTAKNERSTTAPGELVGADTDGHGLLVANTYSQRRIGRTADYQRELRERRRAKATRLSGRDRY